MRMIMVLGLMVLGSFAMAQNAAPPAAANQFEVIDVSGQVSSEMKDSSKEARASWTKACEKWKNEMKDLNKSNGNQILGMNCNSPSCALIDATDWQCNSTGTYKVKTAGVKVPEPPVAPPLPPQQVVMVQPPPPVVEVTPAPRIGFVWIGGYWGWAGASHVWIPGRWAYDQPGFVYVHEAWAPYGHGWRFTPGRWRRR